MSVFDFLDLPKSGADASSDEDPLQESAASKAEWGDPLWRTSGLRRLITADDGSEGSDLPEVPQSGGPGAGGGGEGDAPPVASGGGGDDSGGGGGGGMPGMPATPGGGGGAAAGEAGGAAAAGEAGGAASMAELAPLALASLHQGLKTS